MSSPGTGSLALPVNPDWHFSGQQLSVSGNSGGRGRRRSYGQRQISRRTGFSVLSHINVQVGPLLQREEQHHQVANQDPHCREHGYESESLKFKFRVVKSLGFRNHTCLVSSRQRVEHDDGACKHSKDVDCVRDYPRHHESPSPENNENCI